MQQVIELPTEYSRLKSGKNRPVKNYKLITRLRKIIEAMSSEIAFRRNELEKPSTEWTDDEVISEYFTDEDIV